MISKRKGFLSGVKSPPSPRGPGPCWAGGRGGSGPDPSSQPDLPRCPDPGEGHQDLALTSAALANCPKPGATLCSGSKTMGARGPQHSLSKAVRTRDSVRGRGLLARHLGPRSAENRPLGRALAGRGRGWGRGRGAAELPTRYWWGYHQILTLRGGV